MISVSESPSPSMEDLIKDKDEEEEFLDASDHLEESVQASRKGEDQKSFKTGK